MEKTNAANSDDGVMKEYRDGGNENSSHLPTVPYAKMRTHTTFHMFLPGLLARLQLPLSMQLLTRVAITKRPSPSGRPNGLRKLLCFGVSSATLSIPSA